MRGAAHDPFFYNEEAGAKGLPPLSPAPPIPAGFDRFRQRVVETGFPLLGHFGS